MQVCHNSREREDIQDAFLSRARKDKQKLDASLVVLLNARTSIPHLRRGARDGQCALPS